MKGLLFILSAPSGVGKSTIARLVVRKDRRFSHSISYTTRKPRPGERDGIDYCFVTKEKFLKLAKQGKFLEKAYVHGSHYGSTKTMLGDAVESGKNLVLTIDVVGAKNVAKAYPQNTVRVFILPPDLRTWLARLKQRKEKDWKRRMANAKDELRHLGEYDYCIINDNLNHALKDFFCIVRAEELKRNKREFHLP